jgi:hypothetical protein
MRKALWAVWVAAGILRLPTAHAVGTPPPGAQPGEAFTFKFSVGPVENGRRVLAVHGQAETAAWLKLLVKLDDDYQLLLDADSLLPLDIVSVERGMRERKITSKIDGRRVHLEVTAAKNSGRASRLFSSLVRDPLSELFALRAAPLAHGDQLEHDILDGLALWRVHIDVQRGERLRLESDGDAARSRKAIRIDGELRRIDDLGRDLVGQPKRHVTAWLSDDPTRVLLRLEADTDLGRCALELTSYTPPKR